MNVPWPIVLAALWAVGGAALGVLQWRLVCRLRHRPNSEVAIYLPGLALSWILGWTVGYAVSWALASTVREATAGSSIDWSEVRSLIRVEVYRWVLAGAGGWSVGRLGAAGVEWLVRRRQIDMRFRDWLFLHLFGCWLWGMGYEMGDVGISASLFSDSVAVPLLIWAAGLVLIGGLAGGLSILGLREDVDFYWPHRRP